MNQSPPPPTAGAPARSGLSNLALSEDGFLFDTRTGATFSLNATGTYLLRLLIEGESEENLEERLTGAFEVDEATAARDARTFVERLRDLGLLRVNALQP